MFQWSRFPGWLIWLMAHFTSFLKIPPRTDCGLNCSADPELTILFPKDLVQPPCPIMDSHLFTSYSKGCTAAATKTVNGIYSLLPHPNTCGSRENGLLCRWQPAPGHLLGLKGADRLSPVHCMDIHGRLPVEKEEINLLGCLHRVMFAYISNLLQWTVGCWWWWESPLQGFSWQCLQLGQQRLLAWLFCSVLITWLACDPMRQPQCYIIHHYWYILTTY